MHVIVARSKYESTVVRGSENSAWRARNYHLVYSVNNALQGKKNYAVTPQDFLDEVYTGKSRAHHIRDPFERELMVVVSASHANKATSVANPRANARECVCLSSMAIAIQCAQPCVRARLVSLFIGADPVRPRL
jgi:hypothetical protein